MKLLIRAALLNQKHLKLLIFTLVAMCCLTLSSQLEIFCLGVLTQKGPNFFELFGKAQSEKLVAEKSVSKEQLVTRFNELDSDNKGYVTQDDARHFLAGFPDSDRIAKIIDKMNEWFPIRESISSLAIFFLFVALFKAISLFSHQYSTSVISIRISRDLRQAYFEHLQSLPMSFYHKYNIGSLSARLGGDTVSIATSLTSLLTNYFQTPFAVLTTLIFCFYTSWELSLLIFFGLPILMFPIITIAKKVKRITKQQQKSQEHFASVLLDYLSGIQTVKAFAMEDFSLKKYNEHNSHMAHLEQKNARYSLSTRPIVHSLGIMCLAFTMIFGLYYLQMSIPEILVFAGMLYMFYEPIKKFAEENNHIQRGIAAAERLYEVMSIEPEIKDQPNAKNLTQFKHQIVFHDVWFRYEDRWVLRGLDFTVEKGQMVALVGPTGAGKSTIVQLLPRLYEVQQGQITIDGEPINALTQKSLREMIGFIPQKPFLFLDTVSENISFGRPFTREQIIQAAKRAHADEFIVNLQRGYDTMLHETGKNLSGGQQQRLAIARALVKDAPILVMDEATSSLDAISEHKIKEALEDLRGEITQIVIAHRLSTIEDADKIIYLEHGKKVAEGTREELLRTCPNFRRMWEMMYNMESEEPLLV